MEWHKPKDMFRYLTYIVLASYLILPVASRAADLEKQRLQFLDAEKFYSAHQYTRYRYVKEQLVDYPLYPYLIYREINRNLRNVDANTIRMFFYKYGDVPVAERLRHRYLSLLARRHEWKNFIDFYKDSNSDSLDCTYRKALYITGEKDAAFKGIDDLWLTAKSLPSSCNYIIQKALSEETISTDLLIDRLKISINKRNIRLAYYLAGKLTNSRALKQEIREAHHFPLKFINSYDDKTANGLDRFLYTHALEQLAKKNLATALKLWNETDKSAFSNDDIVHVERRFSYEAYRQRNSPLGKTVEFSTEYYDSSTLKSLVRLNLSKQNWVDVLNHIDDMSKDDAQEEEWLYWRARSLEKLGNYIQAYRIYEDISDNRSFYGFLSSDKLKKHYSMNIANVTYTDAQLKPIEDNPFYKRTREFYALGRPADARREFMAMSAQLDDKDLYKAAQLAHRNKWHDIAILTMSKTPYMDDLNIRFPVINFDNEDNIAVDKAWLLALIRQESMFMSDAKSHRGALGLMQILPRTARYVARRSDLDLGKRYYKLNSRDLLDKDNNVLIGSYYLNRNLKRFDDNPVLATAAYNAGPYNVKKWIPDNTIDADAWIETIPFNETRNYVQRVLTYTSIYEKKLGIKGTTISDRMPAIGSKDDDPSS